MKKFCFFAAAIFFSWSTAVFCEIPKFYNPHTAKEKKVASTGLWKVSAIYGQDSLANTPGGLLAARLGTRGKLFQWEPSPNQMSMSSEADIMDVIMSEDESMLLFVERIGGAGKPNSTRFVFVNLINGKICGGFTISKRRITKAAFIPGQNMRIVAIQEEQLENFNNQNALVIIDLKKGKVISESLPSDAPISSFATNGNRVWYSCKNKNDFFETFLYRLNSTPKRVAGKRTIADLSISSSGGVLQVMQKGFCEFYDITGNGAIFSGSVKLPENFECQWVLPVPSGSRTLIAAQFNGPAYIINGSSYRQIAEKSGAFGCLLPATGQLLLGQAVRGRVSRMNMPECQEIQSINPSSLRPVNRNPTLRLFGRTGKDMEVVQIDTRGNVFRIFITSRRGSKKALLLVDNRGVK